MNELSEKKIADSIEQLKDCERVLACSNSERNLDE